jgi:nucleoside-diphosphate-sugar epimerase
MTQIDKTKPVLVTGATGYIAGWLVKRLLEEGITVHAAVRDPDKKEKVAHLDNIAKKSKGSIKYFKSNLLDKGSYSEAMKGCELVFHTASPFSVVVDDPQRDLIDPAVNGTRNVLETANQTASVKRIVLTSSCAAIYTDATECQKAPGGFLTEEIWNTTASIDYQPYSYSKTLAEKEAWKMAKNQSQWDLVTINPAMVMGPPLNPEETTSESFNILKQMGDGTFKSGAPKIAVGFIDVRDVAEAHYRAGYTPEAKGRYITAGYSTNFFELAQLLLPKFGNHYPLPKSTVPKWLLMLIGPFLNKALSRKFIRKNMNVEWKADNSKIQKELGITFRPMKETMEDAFQALVDADIVKPK